MKQAMDGLSTFDGLERRSRIRFPIALDARYAVVGRQDIKGTGRTMNISSHGVLVTSAREWSPGTPVSVVIEWQILLGSTNCVLNRNHPIKSTSFQNGESEVASCAPKRDCWRAREGPGPLPRA